MAYNDHLLLQLVNSTVEDVSIKEGIAYDCVLGVLERRINTSVDWRQYGALGVIGLDEIALKKGHRNFVVIVTARLVEGRVMLPISTIFNSRGRAQPFIITWQQAEDKHEWPVTAPTHKRRCRTALFLPWY